MAFTRPFLASAPNGFYLSEKVIPVDLQRYFEKLVQVVESLKKLETEEVKIINLEEKIDELMVRISSIVKTNFSNLSDKRDKPEIVVLFLALLHLLKDNRVNIIQEQTFGDINISLKNG